MWEPIKTLTRTFERYSVGFVKVQVVAKSEEPKDVGSWVAYVMVDKQVHKIAWGMNADMSVAKRDALETARDVMQSVADGFNAAVSKED